MMNDKSIFINCPFDKEYLPLLRVLLFVSRFYGLDVKIASTELDSTSNRLPRIKSLMRDSKYSIHDLSRFRSDKAGEYYRMNMPFELGLDYGLGGDDKIFLIFESEPYKLKIALSDINGWDIRAHQDNPEKLVMEFRKWIVGCGNISDELKQYSSEEVWNRYNYFYGSFSDHMLKHTMKDEEISVPEYLDFIDSYLKLQ